MTTTLYIPGSRETDPTKQNKSLAVIGSQTAANTDAIAAGLVNSIAGNTGAFTLNSTSGITNSTNDIKLQQATSSQFGAVKVDGTTITAAAGVISTSTPAASPIKASLGADVALNNTGTYFDGPSVAQGVTGTWFASGTVTLNSSGNDNFRVRLTDGTTVIASAETTNTGTGTGFLVCVTLSGYIASPAGNLRISVKDVTSVNGKILFNHSGDSKDSTISAYRIA